MLHVEYARSAGAERLRLLLVAGFGAEVEHGAGDRIYVEAHHCSLCGKQRVMECHIQLHCGCERFPLCQAGGQGAHCLIHDRTDDPAVERPVGIAHPRLRLGEQNVIPSRFIAAACLEMQHVADGTRRSFMEESNTRIQRLRRFILPAHC